MINGVFFIGNDIELGLETNEPRLVEKNNLNFSWQQQQNSSWQNASASDASFGPMNSPGHHQATPPTRKRPSHQQHRVAAATIAAANKKARLTTDDVAASPANETTSSSSHQLPAAQRTLAMQMVVDVKEEQEPFEADGGHDQQPQLFDPQHGDEIVDDEDDIQEIPRDGVDIASQSLGVGDEFAGLNSSQQQLQTYNPGGGGGAGASGQLLPDGTDMVSL